MEMNYSEIILFKIPLTDTQIKKATNGYGALKSYDLNGDNVIDEKNEIFNKLKIWKGTNSNGITDEGELSSLANNNIKSIDLNYKEISIDENSNTVK